MEPASCRFATEYEKNNKIMKRIIAAIGCLAAMAIIPVQAQERFVDETPQNRKVVLEEFTTAATARTGIAVPTPSGTLTPEKFS